MVTSSGSSSKCVRAARCASTWRRSIRCFTDWKNAAGSAGAGSRNRGSVVAVITGSRRPARKFSRRNAKDGASSLRPLASSREFNMPEFKDEIRKRLEGLRLSPAREAEIVEELSQHLDDQYEQELSHGATEDAAREAVLTELRQSDVLATSLKRVERRVPQNPIQMGTERNRNMFA